MNRQYWIERLNIPKDAEVIFYQSPEFFRSNSFHWEIDEAREFTVKKFLYRWVLITGVCNKHHKHNGKRMKICLVIEKKKLLS